MHSDMKETKEGRKEGRKKETKEGRNQGRKEPRKEPRKKIVIVIIPIQHMHSLINDVTLSKSCFDLNWVSLALVLLKSHPPFS